MNEFGPFRLDTVNQCFWRRRDTGGEERISLTPRAFSVLRYLFEHSGRLVTHDELLNSLWPDTFVQPEVLKSHILAIRQALGDDSKHPRFIETLPKRGYQFIAQVTNSATTSAPTIDVPARKLVGRTTQLGELHDCLRRSSGSQRQIVFITGEAGIGKTTLVDEFLRRASATFPGLHAARGQCVEGFGGKESYFPILEAVSQLCSDSGGEAVVQSLSTHAPTWLVQFPALVNSKQRETLHREILGATRERMLRELGEALETISSDKPLLLVLEDLHWADPSTVDLISSLARRRAPCKLMLIGTYRPVDVTLSQHPLKAVKQDLVVHHLCHEIVLEPLREVEVAEYLGTEAGGGTVPPGLSELIYRHTEGNPLFMVAALDHMRGRGLIAVETGTWRINAPLEKIELEAPESLRQMIELQIERLSAEEQRVLEVMSVLRQFPLSVALGAAVAHIDPDTLEELLEDLVRRHQMIRPAGIRNMPKGGCPCYEFVHLLYREVLYRRIGSARRRRLHQSVAENSKTLHDLHGPELEAELAYQFEEGGDWPRAVKFLLSAADTAGRRFEPRQAAVILEHALELVGKIPESARAQPEIEVLQKLATIRSASFDPRALETYESLVARAAHYELVDVEVRALLEMALPLANFANTDRFMGALERARNALSRVGEGDTPRRKWMRALYLARRTSVGTWDPGDLEECRTLVTSLRDAGDRRLLGEVQLGFGYTLLAFSEYREAKRSADESFALLLEVYEENPYLSFEFHVYEHLVFSCLLFLGEWGEALLRIAHRVEMVEKNDGRESVTLARLERVWLLIYGMDFEGAQKLLATALPLVASVPSVRRHWLIWAGMAEVGLGNYERALDHLLMCRNEMDRHPMMTDWRYRMPLQQSLTEAWLCKGELDKARAEAREFLKITLAAGERSYRALAYEVSARLSIEEKDFDSAENFIFNALQSMEGYEVPLAHWRVHATAAALYRCLRNQGLAKHHRELSRATIMKLANSLPADEPLRQAFLVAPLVRNILGDNAESPTLHVKRA